MVEHSAPLLSSNDDGVPNEMQSAIRELYFTERKGTSPSVRIERIVKPSAPHTIIKLVCFFLSLPNEMQSAICKLYFAERKGRFTIRTDRTDR